MITICKCQKRWDKYRDRIQTSESDWSQYNKTIVMFEGADTFNYRVSRAARVWEKKDDSQS